MFFCDYKEVYKELLRCGILIKEENEMSHRNEFFAGRMNFLHNDQLRLQCGTNVAFNRSNPPNSIYNSVFIIEEERYIKRRYM